MEADRRMGLNGGRALACIQRWGCGAGAIGIDTLVEIWALVYIRECVRQGLYTYETRGGSERVFHRRASIGVFHNGVSWVCCIGVLYTPGVRRRTGADPGGVS